MLRLAKRWKEASFEDRNRDVMILTKGIVISDLSDRFTEHTRNPYNSMPDACLISPISSAFHAIIYTESKIHSNTAFSRYFGKLLRDPPLLPPPSLQSSHHLRLPSTGGLRQLVRLVWKRDV